jgi:hypothetical protein
MYQEPWTPPPGSQPRAPNGAQPPPPASAPVYQQAPPPYPPPPYPSPYVYEPPPPPPTYHRSPNGALWVGARLGALFPFGSAYTIDYDQYGYAYGEAWSGLASGGPSFEADLGARIARKYIVYGFWEHGFMGTGGNADFRSRVWALGTAPLGEQKSASTDLAGLGFRWSSRPDSVGFVVDLGIGYRWFREEWAAGSVKLAGFGEFRAGFGADIRIARTFSLSPLFMFSTGEFHDRTITLAGQPETEIRSYTGSHGTVTLTVGGHFDLGASY